MKKKNEKSEEIVHLDEMGKLTCSIGDGTGTIYVEMSQSNLIDLGISSQNFNGLDINVKRRIVESLFPFH